MIESKQPGILVITLTKGPDDFLWSPDNELSGLIHDKRDMLRGIAETDACCDHSTQRPKAQLMTETFSSKSFLINNRLATCHHAKWLFDCVVTSGWYQQTHISQPSQRQSMFVITLAKCPGYKITAACIRTGDNLEYILASLFYTCKN